MGYTPQTPIGVVLADPQASAVIGKYLPDALDAPMLRVLPLMPAGFIARGALFDGEGADSLEAMWAELDSLTPADNGRPESEAPRPAPARIDAGSGPAAVAISAGPHEQWGLVELTLAGPSDGNPFTDVELTAVFSSAGAADVTVGGFYDGGGVYRVRFQPPACGAWAFAVASNVSSFDGAQGSFEVTAATGHNHGPVQVADRFHFAYRDGTRFSPIGTTAYAWTHQPAEVEERTLATLRSGPFTKVRMCVFPKSYLFNEEEPERYPFERAADGSWDFTRFDLEFFQHLEQRILDLQAIGVEADVILFHCYDRWGFSLMPAWADELYLRYLVRRLAAYRAVWWSLANEYDLVRSKTVEDWERFAEIITAEDHVGHPRSIHNCFELYDHSRPWVTHCSIQRIDVYRTTENTDGWRNTYGKPVIVDECAYEGNIDQGWGNISGRELVRRAWEATVRGGYVTHGETYYNDRKELWWSKGGELVGESPARFAFLARLLAEAPDGVYDPLPSDWDARWGGAPNHRLVYFGFERPSFRHLAVPRGTAWWVDVIDTWGMTVDTLPEAMSGRFTVELPGREYLAIRLRNAATEDRDGKR